MALVDTQNLEIIHVMSPDTRNRSILNIQGNIKTLTNCSESQAIVDIRLTNQYGSEDLPSYISFDNTTMEIEINPDPAD